MRAQRLVLTVAGLLCLLLRFAGGTATAAATPTSSPALRHILADYDAELREATPRADGINHVDTPATIAKLKALHVNTYAFLVWHAATDWDDLRNEFLPAAQAAGINVWVYLVPPSECNPAARCSFPYQTDYVRWGQAIATLSLQYPNVTAWAMDDFGGSNLRFFTPDYLGQMRDAAHAINPALQFLSVVYYATYTPDFVNTYAPYIDGFIFPYRDDPFLDNHLLDSLPAQLDHITSLLNPLGKSLILMVYAAPHSRAPFPSSADYVRGVLQVGIDYMQQGKLGGVITYALPKDDHLETCDSSTDAYLAHHLELIAAWSNPTVPGDYASASQLVTVDPNAASYRLDFSQTDSFYAPTVTGYHFKQLLVDGQVVWEQDVATDAARVWNQESVDLTPYLQGKTSATLTLRLYDKKGVSNFGVWVEIAALNAQGFTVANPDFTTDTSWTFATSMPAFKVAYGSYTCDPQRPQHVFEAVRDLYGPYALVYRVEALGLTGGEQQSLLVKAQTVLERY
jgi:hypothetical protein